MRYLLIGLFVAALVTPATAICTIVNVCVSDDFEAYADGTDLKNCTPIWTGVGPENTVFRNTGDAAVRLKATSGNTASSTSWTAANYAGCMCDGNVQVMEFTLQSDLAMQNASGNHAYIHMNESAGASFPYFYGHSGAMTPRLGGTIGPSTNITDGAVHHFQMCYDPNTGVCTWWADGAQVWTKTIATGLCAERMEVRDMKRDFQDWIWLDDMVMGTTPEPATIGLLLLGLPFLRRRR